MRCSRQSLDLVRMVPFLLRLNRPCEGAFEIITTMSAIPKVPSPVRSCPFCGVATEVPHESQQGCIAALQSEIGRMRGILSTLKPAAVCRVDAGMEDDHAPAKLRVALD